MNKLEWLFWNIEDDADPIFDQSLCLFFRLRNGSYVSHHVDQVKVGTNCDWVELSMVCRYDIPEFIALELRCYDPKYYEFLRRPFHLPKGEKFVFTLKQDIDRPST